MSIISKKRKRELDVAEGGYFQPSAQLPSQLGPVLAAFPAVKPADNTPFKCYRRRYSTPAGVIDEGEDVNEEFSSQDAIIAGEAGPMEFFTSHESKNVTTGCRYFIAVHNRRTQTTVFRPAPLHVLSQRVKALKGLEPARVSSQDRPEARAALGEIFGTKKVQAAIRAAERNKVDVTAMESVMGHLVDRIEKNTETLPTEDQMNANADANRLIPEFNSDAATPSEVYDLHNIIPEPEWKAISTKPYVEAGSDEDRLQLLPHRWSSWVTQHLTLVFKHDSPSKRQLKSLYYISAMLAFRQAAHRLRQGGSVAESLSSIPTIIVDGLVSRFTEMPRGSTQPRVTPDTETKLLTHMFALCLRVDNFATDTTIIAADMQMPLPKVNQLFKALGCKIEKLGGKDVRRLGLPDSAAETKRAVLKVPLQFPKARRFKRGRMGS